MGDKNDGAVAGGDGAAASGSSVATSSGPAVRFSIWRATCSKALRIAIHSDSDDAYYKREVSALHRDAIARPNETQSFTTKRSKKIKQLKEKGCAGDDFATRLRKLHGNYTVEDWLEGVRQSANEQFQQRYAEGGMRKPDFRRVWRYLPELELTMKGFVRSGCGVASPKQSAPSSSR